MACAFNDGCPVGQVCGLQVPGFCSPCASDDHCLRNGYPNTVCAGGACVSDACGNCGSVPEHFCCGVCQYGNCCSTSDCTFGSCVNGVCTTCAEVTGSNYYVDPVSGDDTTGTGGPEPGCAFRTLARAVRVAETSQVPGVVIWLADGCTLAAEPFPIVVGATMLIRTDVSSGLCTVAVAPGATGFILAASDADLSDLLIDGAGRAATGVVVDPGDTNFSGLSDVTVTNMAGDGVVVKSGTFINVGGASFESSGHGGHGVRVTGTGRLFLSHTTTGRAHYIARNRGSGVLVEEAGHVQLTGSTYYWPDLNGGMKIENNTQDGITLRQATAGAPRNVITDVILANNGRDGLNVAGGSNVRMERSLVLANGGNGVHVVQAPGDGGVATLDVGRMDFGSDDGGPGENRLQEASGGDPNVRSGLCVDLPVTAAPLRARGNIFKTAECTDGGVITVNRSGVCAAGVDVSVTQAGNTVDLGPCTQQ